MSRTAGRSSFLSLLRSRALSCTIVACGVVVAACQSGPIDASVDSPQFQDVVVPAGFRLQDRTHESFSREEASWRQGHFVYLGKAGVDESASYVLQRMPQHSWQMAAEQKDEKGESIRLRFERGIYAADYVFSRRDGMTEMVVDYTTDYSRR